MDPIIIRKYIRHTVFDNFTEYCIFHEKNPLHLKKHISDELGTESDIENGKLWIKGRFTYDMIQRII